MGVFNQQTWRCHEQTGVFFANKMGCNHRKSMDSSSGVSISWRVCCPEIHGKFSAHHPETLLMLNRLGMANLRRLKISAIQQSDIPPFMMVICENP